MGSLAGACGAAVVLTFLMCAAPLPGAHGAAVARGLMPASIPSEPDLKPSTGIGPVPTLAMEGWNATITNKASLADYPVSVRGGDTYTAALALLLVVPSGHAAQVRIEFDVTAGFDPSEAARWVFFRPLTVQVFNVGAGTWGAHYLVSAATPIVYRDSLSGVAETVRMFENGVLTAEDRHASYPVSVSPLVRASDIAFQANVIDADKPATGSIDVIRVTVDSVVTDPTGEFYPGKLVFVRSDGLIPGDVVVRDIVEVHGDYHPAEDPKVVAWKTTHFVERIGTRNVAPFLSEAAVSPSAGDDATGFVFSVVYADLDGDVPQVSIVLDGQRLPMEFSHGLVPMDASYQVAATLGPGIHTYRFEADDRAGAPNSAVQTQDFVVVVGSSTLASAIIALDIGAGVAGIGVWRFRSRRLGLR